VATTAGLLKAKRVIHTVGPVWEGGSKGEENLLAAAYRESLALADREGLKSVALPSISTGVYGYPVEAAARVALRTALTHLEGKTGLELVRFVLFDRSAYDAFERALLSLLPTKRYRPR
jgi:O-acetyl-ADP-ribose deacetylase (regulator of RNase III)